MNRADCNDSDVIVRVKILLTESCCGVPESISGYCENSPKEEIKETRNERLNPILGTFTDRDNLW